MKASKYPRFRSLTRRGRSGQVWVYYRYDMRGTGKSDINLGTDYTTALKHWHRLHNHLPLVRGRIQEAIDRWRVEVLPNYANPETRRQYAKQLQKIEAWCGSLSWQEVTLPLLRAYLDHRTAKTQGNRELSVLSIIWSRARVWGMTSLPWPAQGVKDWKNPEQARQSEVTDQLFDALYSEADSVLRDCLDIATATGMRITDVRNVRMPVDGILRFRAGKTGKVAYFQVAESPALTELIARRGSVDSEFLLCTPTGRPVSMSMLRARYDSARAKAAANNPILADQLRAMYLRDARKRAADLAADIESAAKLLQHSSTKLTAAHYRTKATKLTPVR